MENTFILEQENQMAISTEKVKVLRSKRGKSLVAIKPFFLYFPFLGTCLALAYGEMYLWSILLFICGNSAFLWGYITNQASEIDISLDPAPSIDQEQLEGQLYDRSVRNT